MAVESAGEADDDPPPGGPARAFDRDVDGLAAAVGEHHAAHPGPGGGDQPLGEGGARRRRKVVVADVDVLQAVDQRLDEPRVAMSEVVGAAVEVDIEVGAAVEVPDPVAIAPSDDQVAALALPGVDRVGVPHPAGGLEKGDPVVRVEPIGSRGSAVKIDHQRPLVR